MFEHQSANKQKQSIFSTLRRPSGFCNTLRHDAWLSRFSDGLSCPSAPSPPFPKWVVCCYFIFLGSLLACNLWQTCSDKYVLAAELCELMSTALLRRELWKSFALLDYVNTRAQMCINVKVFRMCVLFVCLHRTLWGPAEFSYTGRTTK